MKKPLSQRRKTFLDYDHPKNMPVRRWERMANYLAGSVVIVSLCMLTSCSDESEDTGGQLTADAGDPRNVLVNSQVTLDGGSSFASDGSMFDYSWNFVSKPVGSNASFDDAASEQPTFTADEAGKYLVELTISNSSTDSDTILVSAFDVVTIEGSYENIIPGSDVGIRDFTAAQSRLYATCEFSEIGGVAAKKIASFDGAAWSALGCGLEDGSIFDMIEYQGQLYVTGQFEEIGCIAASNIARWDGSSWSDVEGGLTGGDNAFGYAFAIFNDELYVGGQFTQAGDVNAVNLARWDGTNWSAVGTFENGSVRELAVYQQELYAGGFFTAVNGTNTGRIAVYNGSNWKALGATDNLALGSTGVVRHMVVYQDLLYIAGDFSANSGDVSELITWDGTQFDDFGRAFSLFVDNTISELAVINDVLYIGGDFSSVVASQAGNVIQWDGEQWGLMSTGVSGTVLTIESFNNNIYIGGDFLQAGGQTAENISIWSAN